MLTSPECGAPHSGETRPYGGILRGILTPGHWISGIGIRAPLPHRLGKKAEALSFIEDASSRRAWTIQTLRENGPVFPLMLAYSDRLAEMQTCQTLHV